MSEQKPPQDFASHPTNPLLPGDAHQMSRHLIALSTVIRGRVSDGLLGRGHRLSPSSTQVIPNLPREGLGMSELAARLRLTLQRTGQLVQQLEEDGYVERVPDAHDGRAKRVVYSARGRRLVADIQTLMDEVSQEFTQVLGASRFERLCHDLAALDHALIGVDTPLRIIAGGELPKGGRKRS